MSRKTRATISVIIKFLIFAFATVALVTCMFDLTGFMGGPNILLKYFTNQSNIWIALLDLVLGFALIGSIKRGKYELGRTAYVLQLVFTVSITLTGLIFCAVLVPAFLISNVDYADKILDWPQIFLHVVVPILSIIDLMAFTRPIKFDFKPWDFLWSSIPPIYYLGFEIAGYNLNWNFGQGQNYPYFFMNWASPAGLFGFSKEMPYFMGNGYWILIIVIIVLGFSFFYSRFVNRRIIRNREKLI